MKLAYLTNQYPKISHSFIRGEILALEALGVEITRFSIRRASENFPDPADQAELVRTTFLLDGGILSLLTATLRVALTRPRAFARALRLTVQMGLGSQRGLAHHFAYLAEAAVLERMCAAQGITHLHVHHATNPAAVALLCKTLGGPTYSLTVHGPEEFEHGAQLSLDVKIANAAFVATVSEWSCRELFRRCDAGHHDKIFLVHNGVDEWFVSFPPIPIADTPQLLWVGRLKAQKNPLLLVHAVQQLAAQNIPCVVTILGDGSLRAELEREIARGGLENAILLKGWANRSDILSHLVASRALVLSSRAENVPVVIQEALVQERPVVSTNVGGIDELVQDGVTGWLVPPDSVDALAHALRCTLTTDPAQLEQMGKMGRRHMLENFDTTRQAKQLLALFETASLQGT